MTGSHTSLYVCLVAAGLVVAVCAAAADAQPRSSVQPARPIVLTAGGVSMDQAVKMVEKRFKARVVRAESQQNGGHTIYVLRMLNDSGRVWTVRVDAASGAVL